MNQSVYTTYIAILFCCWIRKKQNIERNKSSEVDVEHFFETPSKFNGHIPAAAEIDQSSSSKSFYRIKF